MFRYRYSPARGAYFLWKTTGIFESRVLREGFVRRGESLPSVKKLIVLRLLYFIMHWNLPLFSVQETVTCFEKQS